MTPEDLNTPGPLKYKMTDLLIANNLPVSGTQNGRNGGNGDGRGPMRGNGGRGNGMGSMNR